MSKIQKKIDQIINDCKVNDPIYVTRPTMPALEDYQKYIEQIWQSKWLTNDGPVHREFEQKLCQYLKAKHLTLFNNGTIALMVAIQALGLTEGEIITTAFTSPATPNSIHWNGLTPVFADIEPETFTLDVDKIEELITPRTKAILPVHIYGYPCDLVKIQEIADRNGLYVIYDAAHAFGVEIDGEPLTNFGDISILSFHATKIYSSIEGGALITNSQRRKADVELMKNLGRHFTPKGEETILYPGLNGKMNEMQAAFGVLSLDVIDEEIEKRKKATLCYRQQLCDIPGIRF